MVIGADALFRLEASTVALIPPALVAGLLIGSLQDLAPGAACLADAAEEYVVPAGSRLLAAPSVQLTLDTKAIVGDRPGRHLDRACGVEPCERFRLHKSLSWLPATALGVVALMGLALVTMREEPYARAKCRNGPGCSPLEPASSPSRCEQSQLVVSLGRGARPVSGT